MAAKRRYETIRDEALKLSIEQRAWLAEALHDSVRTSEEREIERAWIDEVKRRIADVDAGRTKLIPADEVIRELKSKYVAKRRRSS